MRNKSQQEMFGHPDISEVTKMEVADKIQQLRQYWSGNRTAVRGMDELLEIEKKLNENQNPGKLMEELIKLGKIFGDPSFK
jgi:hypothetical protein